MHFFVLEYRKTLFPGLYCLKTKDGKIANFRPKLLQNWTKIPLRKNLNFSTVLTCCFYSLERRFFLLEYRKTHFPSL